MECKLVNIKIGILRPTPSEIENEIINDELSYCTRSQITNFETKIRESYFHIIAKDIHINHRTIIRGPAGSGKSYSTYCLVHAAYESGYLIFYIPTLSSYIEMDIETMSKKIINNFRQINKNIVSNKGLSELNEILDSYNLELLLKFLITSKYPICVSIDQWNCIKQFDDDNLLKKYFGNFSYFDRYCGISIVTVSSSFEPTIDQYHDADIFTKEIRMQPFNSTEAVTMIDYYRKANMFPPVTQLTNETITEITGNLPRNMYFIKKIWITDTNIQKIWNKSHYNTFENTASEYFSNRIESVFRKIKDSKLNSDSEEIAFLVDLYINHKNTQNYTNRWQQSGLFVDNYGIIETICPLIFRSFLRFMNKNDVTSIIVKLLAHHPIFKGNTFELFILRELQSKNIHILATTNLMGENKSNVTIQLSNTHYQHSLADDIKMYPNYYPEDTLIICHPNHVAIDAFMYTQGILYLIQISIQPYSKHGNCAGDIIQKPIPSTECINGELYSSYVEYFLKRSPYPNHRKIKSPANKWHITIKECCKLIYITTSDQLCNKSTYKQSGCDNVLLLKGKKSLEMSFGADIEHFYSN